MLEEQRVELNISEYSVMQTSLEQIFQQFANMEIAETKASLTFAAKNGKCYILNQQRTSAQSKH